MTLAQNSRTNRRVFRTSRKLGRVGTLHASAQDSCKSRAVQCAVVQGDEMPDAFEAAKQAATKKTINNGGWITPTGDRVPIPEESGHAEVAETMGYPSEKDAIDSGAIRVHSSEDKIYLEAKKLDQSTKDKMKDFIAHIPSKDRRSIWIDQRPNVNKEFRNKDDALDYLDRGHFYSDL